MLNKEIKVVVTDIETDRNREGNLKRYLTLLGTAYHQYAAIRLSLNLFTFLESVDQLTGPRKDEINGYFKALSAVLKREFAEEAANDRDPEAFRRNLSDVEQVRDTVTKKMRILTTYSDSFQIYEYILNRREPDIKGTVAEYVDTDELAEQMYQFVFSDNDKTGINVRIQDFVSELPIRLTRQRFYDIIGNTLDLYKDGDRQAALDFVETVRDAGMLTRPRGFDTEFPDLKATLDLLQQTDYRHLDESTYDSLRKKLDDAAEEIDAASGDYLLLTEVLNDTLILAKTETYFLPDKCLASYSKAGNLILRMLDADDIYKASEEFDPDFRDLEGAQEEAYGILTEMEGSLDSISREYGPAYPGEIRDGLFVMGQCGKLTSASLFADLSEDEASDTEKADRDFLQGQKDSLQADFSDAFDRLSKYERRSIMAKVLSMMPVFFETQAEVLDYFRYTLSECGDDSELTALDAIVHDIMLQE